MNWSEMDARERDALVAEKVMGWTQIPDGPWAGCWLAPGGLESSALPQWTARIGPAWEVVEKMASEGFYWDVFSGSHAVDGDYIGCRLDNAGEDEHGEGGILIRVSASTAPEAICLAALRAKGVEV